MRNTEKSGYISCLSTLMKPSLFIAAIVPLFLTLSSAGCQKQRNFVPFLSHEVAFFGGKTNVLAKTDPLVGIWRVRRDQFGAAIDVEGISFAALTNALTTAYGVPRLYSRENNRHGPTYVYLPVTAGISIFVSSTPVGAEVTLTAPGFIGQ